MNISMEHSNSKLERKAMLAKMGGGTRLIENPSTMVSKKGT